MKYLIIVLTYLSLIACKKDSNSMNSIETGIYKGTFTVSYDGKKQTASNIEVVFNIDNTYTSTGNRNPRIPAGGSGTYVIKDNTVLFNDINYWNADFDTGLILNGEYNCTYNNKKLILEKTINSGNNRNIYKYDLIKQ